MLRAAPMLTVTDVDPEGDNWPQGARPGRFVALTAQRATVDEQVSFLESK
jgi:hypothetical protein